MRELSIPDAAIQVYQGMLLFFLLVRRYTGELPHPLEIHKGGSVMDLSSITLVTLIVSLMGAYTPILLAALGELVVEKSGVLNLGVDGMMIIGAVCGFIAVVTTGSPRLGVPSTGRFAELRSRKSLQY